MAFKQFFLILAIIPSASLQLKSQNTIQQVVDYDNLLEKLFSALEQLLKYLSTETPQINLDCVIGIRMVQGQLNVLLSRLNLITAVRDPYYLNVITSEYYKRLLEIRDKAEDVAENAIPNIAKNSPSYYGSMKLLLSDSIWEYDYRTRVTDKSLIYSKVMDHETIDAYAAGACLNTMMVSSCNITDTCWFLMTQPSWIGYSLTHQILYVMVGEQIKCGRQMQELAGKHNQTSSWHLLNVMCANVVKEMNEIDKNNKLSDEFIQDLFMEQVSVCGILGFLDTFSIPWLNAIISWQRPEGCYGTNNMAVFVASMQSRLGMKIVHTKREEKILPDGCLSHKSGMAAGALAVYVRFLIELKALSINGPPILEK